MHCFQIRLAIGLILLPILHAAAAEPALFDGRAWTIGNHQQTSSVSMTEFTLPGQTVDNWRELVTSQVFSDREHSMVLSILLGGIEGSLSSGCPSLSWNVISRNDDIIVYEWHDGGCGGFEPQGEVGRLGRGPEGIHRLAYATKSSGGVPPRKRTEWLAILTKQPFAETAVASRSAAAPPPDALTQRLVAVIVRSGQTCAAGVSSENLSARGLSEWRVQCTGGLKYHVFADPKTGSVTVVRDGG